MKTKKRSSLKFSPLFGQKKGLRQPFLCSNLLPKIQRGGRGMPQFCILVYANYTILAIQSGSHVPMPLPLNAFLATIPIFTSSTLRRKITDKRRAVLLNGSNFFNRCLSYRCYYSIVNRSSHPLFSYLLVQFTCFVIFCYFSYQLLAKVLFFIYRIKSNR